MSGWKGEHTLVNCVAAGALEIQRPLTNRILHVSPTCASLLAIFKIEIKGDVSKCSILISADICAVQTFIKKSDVSLIRAKESDLGRFCLQ